MTVGEKIELIGQKFAVYYTQPDGRRVVLCLDGGLREPSEAANCIRAFSDEREASQRGGNRADVLPIGGQQ